LAKPLANWLFSVGKHDDLFLPDIKMGLPELTPAAPLPQQPRSFTRHF
jgi:hypothetical protein